MLTIRPAGERGHAEHGWLNSWHTFSFADYHDPKQMGFKSLRVINEDRVEPSQGFGTHPHKDMEIITYVLEGQLQHRDSMGTGSIIRPGDVQRMSAGKGVLHSEFNASREELVHFLQIWIVPAERGLPPSYEQKTFSQADAAGRLRLVASPDGRDGSLTVHQDVQLLAGRFGAGETTRYAIAPGRSVWVQVARGTVRLNGQTLETGTGAALTDERELSIAGVDGGEILLFDLG